MIGASRDRKSICYECCRWHALIHTLCTFLRYLCMLYIQSHGSLIYFFRYLNFIVQTKPGKDCLKCWTTDRCHHWERWEDKGKGTPSSLQVFDTPEGSCGVQQSLTVLWHWEVKWHNFLRMLLRVLPWLVNLVLNSKTIYCMYSDRLIA